MTHRFVIARSGLPLCSSKAERGVANGRVQAGGLPPPRDEDSARSRHNLKKTLRTELQIRKYARHIYGEIPEEVSDILQARNRLLRSPSGALYSQQSSGATSAMASTPDLSEEFSTTEVDDFNLGDSLEIALRKLEKELRCDFDNPYYC